MTAEDDMGKALKADGDKLKALTGQDHGPSYLLPSYSDPGRIIFEIEFVLPVELCRRGWHDRYEFGRISCDEDGASFWVQEGGFVDYWLTDRIELDQPGIYILESVTGTYYRGDGWETDDDVEWHLGNVRYATDEEVAEL